VGEHVDAVCSLIASRSVTRRHGGVEVDLALVAGGVGRRGHEELEARRGVLVVLVGGVPLEHRELGVVLERQALVAEVLAQLVDALQAADDQALEVELGRDAQVHVAVQRVEVRDEGPRERAAVERLEDRRLDLDEAVVVEEPAHGGDDPRTAQEELAESSLAIRSSSRLR